MSSKFNDSSNLNIDEDILETIKVRIIDLEKNNIKTREKTRAEMLDEIRSIIIEEVNKIY